MTILGQTGHLPTVSIAPETSDLDRPVFLTGFARSGTTWVNELFRDYLDAGLVNEGQFIITFGLRLRHYGDLRIRKNHDRLMRDLSRDRFFSILKMNYSTTIDWARVKAVPPEFPAIVREILRQIAQHLGKHRIGSKYPAFGRYAGLLNTLFPDCLIVHVVRDGRDCALSHRRMTWGHQNTFAAAVHWRNYLYALHDSSQSMPGRYLEVRYEDLLSKPEPTVQALERFVAGSKSTSGTRLFMKERYPMLRPDKIGQWQERMPRRSQAIFESVAGVHYVSGDIR